MAKQRFPAVERVYSAENHGFLKAPMAKVAAVYDIALSYHLACSATL
jgi:hypothetical protein